MSFDRVAALLIFILGILTLGIGGYFLFFRPAMLPEDVRLVGMGLQPLQPAMVQWLRIIFRTWGGFMVAFGILMVSVAGYMITSRPALLSWGATFSVLVAFGRFLASNIAIHSDYLFFIGGVFAISVVTALRITLNAVRVGTRG